MGKNNLKMLEFKRIKKIETMLNGKECDSIFEQLEILEHKLSPKYIQ